MFARAAVTTQRRGAAKFSSGLSSDIGVGIRLYDQFFECFVLNMLQYRVQQVSPLQVRAKAFQELRVLFRFHGYLMLLGSYVTRAAIVSSFFSSSCYSDIGNPVSPLQ